VDLHGLQGHSLPHHGLRHGCRGVCSSAWRTFSPSFFTDLGVCRVVSLASSHSSLCCCFRSIFFPILCYPRGATTVVDGLGLGQQWVYPGAGWHLLCQTQGSFSQLLTDATPVAPLLLKCCHAHPVQCLRQRLVLEACMRTTQY